MNSKGQTRRWAASSQIIDSFNDDGPEPAIAKALSQMSRVGGDGGGVAHDRNAGSGWWHNSPDIAVALCARNLGPPVFTNKQEEFSVHG